jgi:hypothetical protein
VLPANKGTSPSPLQVAVAFLSANSTGHSARVQTREITTIVTLQCGGKRMCLMSQTACCRTRGGWQDGHAGYLDGNVEDSHGCLACRHPVLTLSSWQQFSLLAPLHCGPVHPPWASRHSNVTTNTPKCTRWPCTQPSSLLHAMEHTNLPKGPQTLCK